MSGRFLLYFADPMCSWCYGFGPELDGLLRERADLRVQLVMGGLRPFNTQKATPEFRQTIAGHWAHVAEQSGLPFNDAALAREGFVYDTEPACRAVVAARTMDAGRALPFMKRVQRAFYAEGLDVTQTGVLADLAAGEGFDRTSFLACLDSSAAKEATREDFAAALRSGVRGFPTLAVGYADARLVLLASGFMRTAALVQRLDEIDALAENALSPARAGP